MSTDNMLRVCPKCGATVAAAQLFCGECGERMQSAAQVQKTEEEATRVTEKEEKWAVKVKNLSVRTGVLSNKLLLRSVVLCVAVLMLVFAFLPFGKTTFYDGDEKYEANFNTIDAIDLSISALSFMNDKEISTSQEYRELEEIDRKIEFGVPTEELVEDYLKLNYKLTLMSVDNAPRIGVILAGALSLVYLVLAVLFVIFSAVAFALQLRAYIRADKSEKPFFLVAVKFMLIMLLLLPIIGYAFSHLIAAPRCGVFAYITSRSAIGVPYIISLVLISLASVYTCICLRISNKMKKTRENFTRVVKNYISVGAFALAMIALVIPAITLRFKQIDENGIRKTSEYISLYELSEVGAEELQEYANISSTTARTTITRASEAALNGNYNGRYESNNILNLINISYARMDFAIMNTITLIITVALYVFLALFAWCVLRKLFLDEACGNGAKTFKIFSVIFAITNAILIFVLAMISDACVTGNLVAVVDVKIAAGPIIALVCTVIAAIFAQEKKDMTEFVEYDNADVSYAPYVVEFPKI